MYSFDIETVVIYNDFTDKYVEKHVDKRLVDPVKIEKDRQEKRSKLALNPLTSKIIVCGFNNSVGKGVVQYCEEELIDEKRILLYSLDYIYHAYEQGEMMVTFNGKVFDLPFFIQRCIINHVYLNMNIIDKLLHKYNNDYHLDLRSYLPHGTLNEVASLILGTSLDDGNGSIIDELYSVGDMEGILNKNRMDIEKTLNIGLLI